MKRIVAVNASPRVKWNTAQLVREAAAGAQDAGAEVEVVDLYKLDAFTGCRSCFHCKLEKYEGTCVIKDGLRFFTNFRDTNFGHHPDGKAYGCLIKSFTFFNNFIRIFLIIIIIEPNIFNNWYTRIFPNLFHENLILTNSSCIVISFSIWNTNSF